MPTILQSSSQTTQVKKSFSLDKNKNPLGSIIANYRLKITLDYLDQYINQYTARATVYLSPYQLTIRMKAVLFDLLASKQWTLPEKLPPVALQRTREYDEKLVKLFGDDFLRYFDKANSLVSYVVAIQQHILDNFNNRNSTQWELSELSFYSFSAKEKEHYLGLFNSLGLEDKDGNLFTTDMIAEADSNAQQYKLNMIELFSCIAHKLYEHDMVEGALKYSPVPDELSGFTVDGVCIQPQNLIKGIQDFVGSSETSPLALVPKFTQSLEQTVSASRTNIQKIQDFLPELDNDIKAMLFAKSLQVQDTKFWDDVLGLSNDIKKWLCDKLLQKNPKLWNDFILRAIKNDKDFLRYLILSPDSLFFGKLSVQNHASLCALFVEETDTLNVLLDTQDFRGRTQDLDNQKKQFEPAIREHFLKEEPLRALAQSFKDNDPRNEAIRRFIANYSAAVYGKLLDDAQKESSLDHFKCLIQYIPHDERSAFAELVSTDDSFRKQYIGYLKRAIIEKDKELLGLLTDWIFRIDAEGVMHRNPLFCAAKDMEDYVDLMQLCIDNKQYDILNILLGAQGWSYIGGNTVAGQVNTVLAKFNPTFRQQYIKFLSQAIEAQNFELLDILTDCKSYKCSFQIKEPPLDILVATEPTLYAGLLALSAATPTVLKKLLDPIERQLGHSSMKQLCSELKNNEKGLNALINSSSRDLNSLFHSAVHLLALDNIGEFIEHCVAIRNYQELSTLCGVAGYVLDNPQVREIFIDVLHQAILDNNQDLINSLTKDSQNLTSLIHHLFVSQINCYIRLIDLCIEHKNSILLQKLLMNKQTISAKALRSVIIDKLAQAVMSQTMIYLIF